MRVITNRELIARKVRLARLGSLFGFALVLGGLALYWVLLYGPFRSLVSTYGLAGSYAILLLGFVIGSYGNRQWTLWVQEPRADQALVRALKGLDDKHVLYNFVLPAGHLLLAPYGLFVIKAKGVDGRVTCWKDHWRRNFNILRLVRGFAPEPLGNPTKDTKREIDALHRFIKSKLPDRDFEIQGAIVFTHPRVYLEVTSPSVPAMPVRSLKAHLRKFGRQQSLPATVRQELETVFAAAAGNIQPERD